MSVERQQALIERLGVVVESRTVRAAFVVLIILSVLPYPQVETAFRPIFLLAFGIELLVRAPLLLRRRRTREASLGEVAFLLIDFAAFLSFLPLEDWLHQHFEWLMFMRLSRLLVLSRFAKELAADVYSILTRREQLQQFGLVTVAVGALAFVSAVILSQLRIPHDYDGLAAAPDGFWDRLWWSFRQLESADNLVANLHVHPVVGALSLGLTITGVFVISFIIGIGTNIVEQVVRAERRRKVGYAGHTIVIGPIEESEVLVREFVRIYSKNRRDLRDMLVKLLRWMMGRAALPRAWRLPRMALLGPGAEAPPVLLEPGMRWVVYRQGDGSDTEALERIGASSAKRAILLGNRHAGPDADAITVATLAALRELNPKAHVFLELLNSRNFSTLHALGAGTRTFALDVPWFLGLFLLHHLVVPGVERLYQLLLTAEGSELYSHVYLRASEIEDLRLLGGEDAYVSFEVLSAIAETHGIVLVGVLLGTAMPELGEHDLIPTEALVPWVNPNDAPTDPRLVALDAQIGRVPLANLRGVIAVAETYQPVRAFARTLTEGPQPVPKLAPARCRATVGAASSAPRRILVVGYADAVASLTHRLSGQRRDASVVVAFDGTAEQIHSLRGALRRVELHLDEAGPMRWSAALDQGGQLEVWGGGADGAMDTALVALAEAPVDAVVFLPDPDAVDADARTAMRMMQLTEHLLTRPLVDEPPHILAAMTSLAKGERARLQLELAFVRSKRTPPRFTLVSTEQVRNYFMVHSAFVPSINEVYGQLLGEKGQDLVKLPLDCDGPVRLDEIRVALAEERFVALGFECEDGTVLLNPPADQPVEDVRAVFAIGDADED